MISVSETSADAFRTLLRYLYTEELELNDEVVIDVLRKANEYHLVRAYNLCMRYCARHTSPSNAVGWFLRAHTCRLDELRNVVLAYLRHNFGRVRDEARQTLDELMAHPELQHEIMLTIGI